MVDRGRPKGSLLLQTVLGDSLGSQLSQHILQVVGVWIAVACQVPVHLGLVVDLIPHDCVCLTRGAGCPHSKDEPSLPGHLQELQDLAALRVIGQIALPGKASGCEWFPRAGVLRTLDAVLDVVNNEYSSAVFVAWERRMVPEYLHLSPRLCSSLLPIDGFARWTLQTPVLVPIAIHCQQAQQVEGMAALGEAAHSHGPKAPAGSHITVPGSHRQFLHADDAVLIGGRSQLLSVLSDHVLRLGLRHPFCKRLLDPAGLWHLHGHSGGGTPWAAGGGTAGEGGTLGEKRANSVDGVVLRAANLQAWEVLWLHFLRSLWVEARVLFP